MKIRLKHECCIGSKPYPRGSVHDLPDRVARSMIPRYAEEVPDEEPLDDSGPVANPGDVQVTGPIDIPEAAVETAELDTSEETIETAALDTSEETATKPQPLFRRRGRHHKTRED